MHLTDQNKYPHSLYSGRKKKWLSYPIMILPLMVSCLLAIMVYAEIISTPFTEQGFGFAKFLFFEAESNKMGGLLVDLVWWQSLGSSFSLSFVYGLIEVTLALLLILLLKDNLPYTAIRLTLLATVWLVPLTSAQQVFSILIEQTNFIIPQWQVDGAATIWRNSSLASFVLYILWSKSLKDNQDVSRVYRLGIVQRISLFLSQSRQMLLLTFIGLLVIHFDPAAQWTQVHSQRTIQAINPSLDYLQYISAAQALSLAIEFALLLALVITYVRRPAQ